MTVSYDQLEALLLPFGLEPLGRLHGGAFMPPAVSTLVLIGHTAHRRTPRQTEGTFWNIFARSLKKRSLKKQNPKKTDDPADHALDRWSQEVLDNIAAQVQREWGNKVYTFYPFQGPPHYPFQQWAMEAGYPPPSPLGLLLHREYGTWFAFRGALGFETPLIFPDNVPGSVPDSVPGSVPMPAQCDDCTIKPCLHTCPVQAIVGGTVALDRALCAAHLRTPAGDACLHASCLARRACPVGQDYASGPEQGRFHLTAFRDTISS